MLKQNQTFLWVFILQHADDISQSSSRWRSGSEVAWSFRVVGLQNRVSLWSQRWASAWWPSCWFQRRDTCSPRPSRSCTTLEPERKQTFHLVTFSGSRGTWASPDGVPHLLHHQFGRSHSDGDAHVGQLVQNVLEVQVPPGFGSGEGAALKQTPGGLPMETSRLWNVRTVRSDSYRSVARGAERLRHSMFGSRQNITAGSHRSSDQNRLTCELEGTEHLQHSSEPQRTWQSTRIKWTFLVIYRD